MADYYDDLLALCGFERQEIDQERPRIEKVFQKLELGPTDMSIAEKWVTENHNIELNGVRKLLGLWLKELFDLVLAKEEGKKLLYYGFPTISGPAAVIAATSEDIYCTCPDVVFCYTLGQIFNKLNPVLEAGEANGLPAGHSLCSLQQIRVGGMAKGIIPVPDMVITSSYNCDMGSKTDELLHYVYHHPAVYVDGSMDSRWGEFPDFSPKRVEFLGSQLEKVFQETKEILGVEVTDEARLEGALRGRKLSGSIRQLIEMIKLAEVQPLSIVDVEIARRLATGSASRRIITEGAEIIDILNEEVQERIEKGIGIIEKDAPRVMILMGHFSDPSIMRMMENSGLSIPVTLHTLFTSNVMKSANPIQGESLAKEQLERGPFHSAFGEIKKAAEAVQKLNIDGFIFNYIFNCRPIALLSHLLKQYVEKETGIPVLSLETDMYDSRSYSAASLKTKVETFAEILRSRKML